MGRKRYGLVIIDEFSRFTWVLFFANKDEFFIAFKNFAKKVHNEVDCNITSIRTGYDKEFKNHLFEAFHDGYDISHNFFAPYTPQQNGAVERKNRTLQING